MLLFTEKVAQYRGDTSKTNQVQLLNNRITTTTIDQSQKKVLGLICMEKNHLLRDNANINDIRKYKSKM